MSHIDEREEKLKVAQSLQTFGGSFHSTLGSLLIKADSENSRKIKNAFKEDWEKYLKMYEFIQVPQ